MHRLIALTVLLAFVAVTNPAHAREPTRGKSLWSGCTADFFTPTYFESYAACRAYVIAVADVLSTGDSVAGFKACILPNASKADITERVVGWLEAHPSRRSGSQAHRLVAEAIASAYPCK